MRRLVDLLFAAGALLFAYVVSPIEFASDHALPAAAQPQDPRQCVPTAMACVAINPDVTVETIAQTVCMSGYTAGVRPATSYIHGIKEKLGRNAGLTPEAAQAMVLDHIIPLALGGHPRDPSNLQLQEVAESHRKDRIEVKLQCLVCTGQVPLSEARVAIATDWRAAYHQYATVKCHRDRVRVTDRRVAAGKD
jgi:hypothetical protein